jgi:hypothetical protein
MSLSYTFAIKTELSSDQIAKILALKCDVKLIGKVDLLGHGVSINIGPEEGLGQTIIYESFGFRPTISVVFGLHASELSQGESQTGKSVAALLQEVPGSAVLLYNNEEWILQRADKKILARDNWSEWITSELDSKGIPYEKCEIAIPVM